MDKKERKMTRTDAANAHASRLIAAHIAAGMSQEAAIDAVLGAGTYAKLVSDLYDGLRAKAVRS